MRRKRAARPPADCPRRHPPRARSLARSLRPAGTLLGDGTESGSGLARSSGPASAGLFSARYGAAAYGGGRTVKVPKFEELDKILEEETAAEGGGEGGEELSAEEAAAAQEAGIDAMLAAEEEAEDKAEAAAEAEKA